MMGKPATNEKFEHVLLKFVFGAGTHKDAGGASLMG